MQKIAIKNRIEILNFLITYKAINATKKSKPEKIPFGITIKHNVQNSIATTLAFTPIKTFETSLLDE